MKDEILGLFTAFLDAYRSGENTGTDHLPPDRLRQAFDFTLSETGKGPGAIADILEAAARYTPDVQAPIYLGYFYSAPDPVGLVGDFLISLLNTNVHAYEASPFFSLAEIETVRALSRVVGYGEESDGIFCPGGSYSNMLAMHMARVRFLKRNKGMTQDKLACFVSEGAHYSFDRAAALLGFLPGALVKVKTDRKGRMITDDLDEKIRQATAEGKSAFMVCATLGTTVLGAFDPIDQIRSVTTGFKDIWLHVDAAWGGAILMADGFRDKAYGIQTADSVTWDFHKALAAPVLCSVLLQKKRVNFSDTVAADTSYLFHGEAAQETFNLGEKTPQCGRRADAFKFWLMWKIQGKAYFARQVEKRFALAKDFIALVKENPAFLILDDTPDYWNIGFWYLPKQLRHLTAIEEASEKEKAVLSELTVAIHNGLLRQGRAMINYAVSPECPCFLRMVINNARLEKTDLMGVIDHIKTLGDDACRI